MIGGKDVRACKKIPPKWKAVFAKYAGRLRNKIMEKETEEKNQQSSMKETGSMALCAYEVMKQVKMDARNPRKASLLDEASVTTYDTPSCGSTKRLLEKPSSKGSDQKKFRKSNLVTISGKNLPLTERQLSLAINRMVIIHHLPFSFSRSVAFKEVLALARMTNNSYKPPTKQEMGGDLLNANYAAYQAQSIARLMSKADIFGMSIFGDGATIVKTPMINILASSAGNPHCVLDVIDCSNHVAEGNKKDAFYICQQMLPRMRELDPRRELFDLIAFDGAANVQKAGKLIEQYFPRCSVMKGIEHTASLYFGKISALSPIRELNLLAGVVSLCRIVFSFHFTFC